VFELTEKNNQPSMSKQIESYALIGDCSAAALVSREGSIDWLCWPRFDSPACFAALLGSSNNGHWKLAPAAPARITRRYRRGTLILETTFETEKGSVTIVDFMPAPAGRHAVVRLIEGKRGQVEMKMELAVRFDYGYAVPWVRHLERGGTVRLRELLLAFAGLSFSHDVKSGTATRNAGDVVKKKLTQKQRKLVENMAKGMPQGQAAIEAGYAPKYACQAAYQALESVRKLIPEVLDRVGLTDDALIEKHLLPMLNATETKYFPYRKTIRRKISGRKRSETVQVIDERTDIA